MVFNMLGQRDIDSLRSTERISEHGKSKTCTIYELKYYRYYHGVINNI